jgi:heterodisulfide reductase subunit A2
MKESVSMSEKNNENEDQSATLRIGVFICDCGSNIAGHLDCKAVTEYASTLPDVVYAKENLYTCSESGIAEIQNAVKEQNLNRVLVASCSPRTHQPLFSSSCAQAGLNPYLFEMANIRDQCSWVHMGLREDATEKAKNLVRMGVAKSRFLEPQQDIEGDITPRVMVVGGGMAGLSAAESLAGMGLETILVEREPELGGLLNHISELAPEGDKAADRISALVDSLKSLPNLTTYTASEVTDVSGYIGNFEATIESKDGKTIEEKIGCIVMATGAVPFKPEGMYGYDGKRVITQMELENLVEAGAVNAEKVVMIQCVGARSPEREYCSRICCMTAVKNARLIKKLNPQAEVLILYRDIQMYGTKKEQMLWDARSEGVAFDVYTEDHPPVVEDGTVRYYQSLMGKDVAVPCDLVVLSTPLVPREDAAHFSQLLRVPIDQNGFFLEAHAKLRPLDFATDGIFVCGSARYPATGEEARSQGFGVAARVASILFKDKLVISALVAQIDPDTCVGCKGCMEMCPYDAISYSAEKNICEVNKILCKGCGACAATCPSQSALLKGFKPQQLLSQIRAA